MNEDLVKRAETAILMGGGTKTYKAHSYIMGLLAELLKALKENGPNKELTKQLEIMTLDRDALADEIMFDLEPVKSQRDALVKELRHAENQLELLESVTTERDELSEALKTLQAKQTRILDCR